MGSVVAETVVRADSVVLENPEMRLVVSSSGTAQSLIHKPSGQECLAVGTGVPMFTVTQYRLYDNELQLAYPAKVTSFPAQLVRREGDRLIVTFALVGYEATIGVKINDAYIAFQLERLQYKGFTSLTHKRKTPIDETLFMQLPVLNRKNLGEWLNVMWDEQVAVNLLATDYHARIDAQPCGNYHLLQAGTVGDVQSEGAGAALITTAPHRLLDRIARVEQDYDLPRGVESRRRKEYQYSYYEIQDTLPSNIDRHLEFAKMGGFRLTQVYYLSFAKTAGHFEWRPEYPGGGGDLRRVVDKIRAAGMVPGIHIHYNKAHKQDPYVTPKPDPRLNLRRSFTLAAPIDETATVIPVEENPALCALEEGRRILRIQNELVAYERYTTSMPYQFEECRRGELGTQATAHVEASRVGLLDVDDWPVFVRFTQDTSIQEEAAERLGRIYREAGFEFTYFDGAEDVPVPYWYTVSRAQLLVYQHLEPKPLFAEGACKSHFSWHILTRGNAFDIFRPEVIKAATQTYAAAEAPRVAKDFTSINFGWIGYWAPSHETIGTQPDMLEYVTSRAAAWGCPIALVGNLKEMEAHPRTPDNLEVIRRWEDVRAQGWLKAEHRMELRNLKQEHTLLINERKEFELAPCKQIEMVAGTDQPGRAFIFERGGKVYVTYWHTSGEATLELPLVTKHVQLMKELGEPQQVRANGGVLRLPLGERRYLECASASCQEVINSFQRARILPG
jgi:hypothetical protein